MAHPLDPRNEPKAPQRKAPQRLERLTDLLGHLLAGLLISFVFAVAIDGLVALLDWADWASTSGWLAIVFPGITIVEQYRAANGRRGRLPVALLGAVAGVGLGVMAAGVASALPALFSGAIGALVAVITYAAFWHIGLVLADRTDR